MRDDDLPTPAERRVQAVLRPTNDRAAAVAGRALTPQGRPSMRLRPVLISAVTITVLIVGALMWRASPNPQPTVHIWGSGSLVVVTRDDGQRWIVDGGREPEARGNYVIVVPQSQ
jgi:hypothetical protein